MTSLESSCHPQGTAQVRTSEKSPQKESQSDIGLLTQVAAWMLAFQHPLLADQLVKTEQHKTGRVSQVPFGLWNELVSVGLMRP